MRVIVPDEVDWREEEDPLVTFQLQNEKAPVISLVGAGGKTTVLEGLARAYLEAGREAVVTTTTHMFCPGDEWAFMEESVLVDGGGNEFDALKNFLAENKVVWIGKACGNGKMEGVCSAFFQQAAVLERPILIEADGARRLPVKMPGEWEPVIKPETTVVIGVMGMDGLGKKLKDVCFRSELAGALLEKSCEDQLSVADYIKIIVSRRGLRKGVSEDTRFIIVLNKVEDEERKMAALEIRAGLKEQTMDEVYLTCFGCKR